jgi:hypothetical protein
MSEPLFNIVFYGILQPGKDKDAVLQNMATMFKTEPAKLAPYFAGGRKVIKGNVDELIAEKYRVALDNIGLVIKIEDAAPADQATASPANNESASIDTGDISMAEVGADVIENPTEVPAQPIEDISDISMAEVGADVVENPVEVTPQPIEDISDISMAEVGVDIVENPKEKEKAPEADISELSLK